MKKMIVVGNEIFDEFIKEDGYYVDKTELIYDLVARSRNKVTLFTRPRRFGKTLTMSMMESFFWNLSGRRRKKSLMLTARLLSGRSLKKATIKLFRKAIKSS